MPMGSNTSDILQQAGLMETFKAMCRQEKHGYTVSDYLIDVPANNPTYVDEECRKKMAEWCIDIINYCNYRMDTAEIAISILDRFVYNDLSILLNRSQYQLATITALYTAIKVHEQEVINLSIVSKMSGGIHSPQAIVRMEERMLSAIQWRVNSPTAMFFVRHMLETILPSENHHWKAIDEEQKDAILELATVQVALSISEYDFLEYPASQIAVASLMNAMGSMGFEECGNVVEAMMEEVTNDSWVHEIRDIRILFYEAMGDAANQSLFDGGEIHTMQNNRCEHTPPEKNHLPSTQQLMV